MERGRRLLLIVNGRAGRITAADRGAVARTLRTGFDLEVVQTKERGHATELASRAEDEGVDLVAAFRGDGTINEVANGMAGGTVPLAVVPGGGADVFGRSLGLPRDPVAAARRLVSVDGPAPRTIPLGRVGDRWFVSNCGVGLDASIVRHVEAHQVLKRAGGDWYFAWTALRLFAAGFDRRTPRIEVEWGDGSPTGPGEPPGTTHGRGGVFSAIVQNTDPYTFFRNRPLRLCPDASLAGRLDLLSIETMGVRSIASILMSGFGSGRHVTRKGLAYLRDRPELRIRCSRPMPVQADGEFLGEHTELSVRSVPGALSIAY